MPLQLDREGIKERADGKMDGGGQFLKYLSKGPGPINPLGPKSVQHQFSPNVINTLSRRKVIRIINKGKNFYLLTNSLN